MFIFCVRQWGLPMAYPFHDAGKLWGFSCWIRLVGAAIKFRNEFKDLYSGGKGFANNNYIQGT